MDRVLCVIPARGGSKAVPLKNIAPVAGRPLLHYALTAALSAKTVSRIVVSSDHPEILAVAARYGMGVPLERPDDLAQDDTPSAPVALHALQACEVADAVEYSYVLLLQATNPLVTPDDIDATVSHLIESGADSCVSVVWVPNMHPSKFKRMDGDRLTPYFESAQTHTRQNLEPVYTQNHSCYAVKRSVLLRGNLLGDDVRGVVVPKERYLDIDDASDLRYADFLLTDAGAAGVREAGAA